MRTLPLSMLALLLTSALSIAAPARPNIVLVMADDQGWGETAYNGHPFLKTPHLDAMAAAGLRFDRFYSAAPVCSPTRASIMTGRHPNRSGVFAPNYATRPQEIALPRILKDAGYRTGHFGKWHLGAVKAACPVSPGRMGFEEYLAHDNFFEIDPMFSRNGADPTQYRGESSMIVADAACEFIRRVVKENRPFFVVVWFGSPHAPHRGTPEDVALYGAVPQEDMRHRFAEITALDRAVGRLRQVLRDLDAADNTLVWYTSDNGISVGDARIAFNGGWRGMKGTIYEGGLRVPAVVEWPAVVKPGRTTAVPCVSSDIFATVLDLAQARTPDPRRPIDGISLKPLIVDDVMKRRPSPIGFWKYGAQGEAANGRWMDSDLTRGTTPTTRNAAIDFINYRHPVARNDNFTGEAAWTDNQYKLMVRRRGNRVETELYDLAADPREQADIANQHPDIVKRMAAELDAWRASVERSLSGADY